LNSNKIRIGKQEDSHEFLLLIIDAFEKHDSLITKAMFNGYLTSRVICKNCNHKSETRDSIKALSLEINNKMGGINSCLQSFCGEITLDFNNK